MTRITCKDNVRLNGVTPALAWIFYVLDGFVRHSGAKYLPDELVITAIYDGKHLPDSKHYIGEAVDVRSKNFQNNSDRNTFRGELESALNTHPLTPTQGMGGHFRVLFEDPGTENEHYHIQVRKGTEFPGY